MGEGWIVERSMGYGERRESMLRGREGWTDGWMDGWMDGWVESLQEKALRADSTVTCRLPRWSS